MQNEAKMISLSKSLFTGLIVLTLTTTLSSQELAVKNVRFKQGKDSTVVVSYDLIGDASKKYTVTLSLYMPDTKETVPLNQKYLFGDVGKNVRAGRGKKVVWDLLKDFPKGLHNEGFVFTVDVDAQKGGNKLPWIAGGIAAAGGTAALIAILSGSQQKAEELPFPPRLP